VDVAGIPAALAPAPGVRVVEVPADRLSLRAEHAALRATVDAAVAAA
jgi:2-succinyl-5-enolpyruvyl-6-hydroxy-3-cyclohexene-1-carboxylate synthase